MLLRISYRCSVQLSDELRRQDSNRYLPYHPGEHRASGRSAADRGPDNHHSLTAVGRQKDDACGFECPAHLVTRRFVHLERVSGLKALERGKRYQRSEEHTSELPSLMRISYADFCL